MFSDLMQKDVNNQKKMVMIAMDSAYIAVEVAVHVGLP
jgi:hypothetical protein